MGRKLVSAAFLLGIAVASPAHAVDKATAVLKDASGNEVGTATLTTTPRGVLISLDLTRPSTG